MIAIVDYGVGNLFSLSSSVRSLGAEVRVTRDAADLRGSRSYPAAGRRGIRRRNGQARSHGPCARSARGNAEKAAAGHLLRHAAAV